MTLCGLSRLVASLGCAACIATAVNAQALPASTAAADVPIVESFDLEQVDALVPGVPLVFTVFGSPGATVTLSIEGGQRLVDLPETQAGVYEGAYVIDGRDRIRSASRVVATLQRGGMVARSTLAEPLQLERGTAPWGSAPVPPAPAFAAAPRVVEPTPVPVRQACADCAVVESIELVSTPSVGLVGALTGAVAGPAATHPLGEGHGKRVMRVVGAIAGSWLGREIERRTASSPAPSWRVVLRLADGQALERRYESPPGFRVGESVSLSGRGATSPSSLL